MNYDSKFHELNLWRDYFVFCWRCLFH